MWNLFSRTSEFHTHTHDFFLKYSHITWRTKATDSLHFYSLCSQMKRSFIGKLCSFKNFETKDTQIFEVESEIWKLFKSRGFNRVKMNFYNKMTQLDCNIKFNTSYYYTKKKLNKCHLNVTHTKIENSGTQTSVQTLNII